MSGPNRDTWKGNGIMTLKFRRLNSVSVRHRIFETRCTLVARQLLVLPEPVVPVPDNYLLTVLSLTSKPALSTIFLGLSTTFLTLSRIFLTLSRIFLALSAIFLALSTIFLYLSKIYLALSTTFQSCNHTSLCSIILMCKEALLFPS